MKDKFNATLTGTAQEQSMNVYYSRIVLIKNDDKMTIRHGDKRKANTLEVDYIKYKIFER